MQSPKDKLVVTKFFFSFFFQVSAYFILFLNFTILY